MCVLPRATVTMIVQILGTMDSGDAHFKNALTQNSYDYIIATYPTPDHQITLLLLTLNGLIHPKKDISVIFY